MKLYYVPGACSLASHIMLHEVGANFHIESVDTKAGVTDSGRNYIDINANGYVPTLETDTGEILVEGVAILQYLADTNAEHAYAPALGTIERARLQQFLNYAAAELHKSWGPLFNDATTDAERAAAKDKVKGKLSYLESVLSDGRDYLVDNTFSVSDAYTFVMAYWANYKDIDLATWPHLSRYVDRIAGRPSAQAAFKAEGLA